MKLSPEDIQAIAAAVAEHQKVPCCVLDLTEEEAAELKGLAHIMMRTKQRMADTLVQFIVYAVVACLGGGALAFLLSLIGESK